jgi:hypothetical protein
MMESVISLQAVKPAEIAATCLINGDLQGRRFDNKYEDAVENSDTGGGYAVAGCR